MYYYSEIYSSMEKESNVSAYVQDMDVLTGHGVKINAVILSNGFMLQSFHIPVASSSLQYSVSLQMALIAVF